MIFWPGLVDRRFYEDLTHTMDKLGTILELAAHLESVSQDEKHLDGLKGTPAGQFLLKNDNELLCRTLDIIGDCLDDVHALLNEWWQAPARLVPPPEYPGQAQDLVSTLEAG